MIGFGGSASYFAKMSNKFSLQSKYKPSGDQPEAILQLTDGLGEQDRFQTLLGATGTGKTFTIANVIQNVQKPTLVIAHNKTLAAQLCNEFRHFFPDNAVEYFVSYYDYYQPEAYIARTDTYIEKEAMINQEIDRLRHSATQALLTREDVIICASVSCIYGLGAPEEYQRMVLHIETGEDMTRADTLQRLIDLHFTRTNADLLRGTFRALGEVLEIMPVNEECIYRIEAPRGVITRIERLDPVTRKVLREQADLWIFPAKHFVTSEKNRKRAVKLIREELKGQLAKFEKEGKPLEAERLERRTKYDIEMIEAVGFCNGIENYSQPLSGRKRGEPPDTLLSYFPDDFLTVIDESHVTIPQIGGMYYGDQARKASLVEHGFRLPSAADNRPLTFDEFTERVGQAVFVSATPAKYEFEHSAHIVEQIIRPTGLVDPEVVVLPVSVGKKPSVKTMSDTKEKTYSDWKTYPGQVEDLLTHRITPVIKRKERVLVTTLTKKMAEDLTDFMKERKFKVQYLHSGIEIGRAHV